jgi:hypothetical protein
MNFESTPGHVPDKARTRTGCRACFAVASQRALPQQGMVSFPNLPFAPCQNSHFFLAEQHGSLEGRRVKIARFVRVHRSVAESLDVPPALAHSSAKNW